MILKRLCCYGTIDTDEMHPYRGQVQITCYHTGQHADTAKYSVLIDLGDGEWIVKPGKLGDHKDTLHPLEP